MHYYSNWCGTPPDRTADMEAIVQWWQCAVPLAVGRDICSDSSPEDWWDNVIISVISEEGGIFVPQVDLTYDEEYVAVYFFTLEMLNESVGMYRWRCSSAVEEVGVMVEKELGGDS